LITRRLCGTGYVSCSVVCFMAKTIKTVLNFLMAAFFTGVAVTLFDAGLNIGVRRGFFRISSFADGVRFFAQDGVVNVVIIAAISLVALVFVFCIRLLLKRPGTFNNLPWPFIFALSAALVLVFLAAVQMKAGLLSRLLGPKTIKVMVMLISSIPFSVLLFTFVGKGVIKLYARKSSKVVTGVTASLIAIVIVYGLALAEEPVTEVATEESTTIDAPNVLIIVIDALRRDHVSFYCGDFANTPNLDRIAADSIVFTDAYSNAPWTIPSVTTMFTSRYPSVFGADVANCGNGRSPTLAEVLNAYGYVTEAYSANAVPVPEMGFARGFDRYVTYCDFPPLMAFKRSTLYLSISFFKGYNYWTGKGDTTRWLTETLCSRLEEKRSRSFFIYAHYLDPHGPLSAPVEFISGDPAFKEKALSFIERQELKGTSSIREGRSMIAPLYKAEVEYVDGSVGEVFKSLEEEGLLSDTMVIITADHGEELFDHGRYGHAINHNVEVMAIPLIIYAPGVQSEVSDYPVSLVDVMPTVLSYVGADIPNPVSGRDVLSLVGTEPADFRSSCVFFDQVLLCGAETGLKSVYSPPYILTRVGDGDYKYKFVDTRINDGGDVVDNPPSEQFDLYKAILEEWIESIEEEATDTGIEIEIEPARLESLRKLGYF